MNKKLKQVISKLYFSTSVLIVFVSVWISYEGTIRSTMDTRSAYTLATETHAMIAREREENDGFSPTMFLAQQSKNKEPCFHRSGKLKKLNQFSLCGNTIADFEQESLFASLLYFFLYIFLTAVVLILFKIWIKWLFLFKADHH